MPGKFELKRAKDGQWFFNLLATNGQIILTSEMYKARASAENGIDSVKRNAAEEARYERKEGKNGKPYFVLKATNSQVIGQSQMYASARSRDDGIESVKRNAPDAPVVDLTSEA